MSATPRRDSGAPAPPAEALAAAWRRWSAFVNGVGLGDAAHARLARFNPCRRPEADHLRLVADLLSRGVSVLQSALAWDRPAVGPSRRADDAALARGGQWRLVMGYAGFELVAKALLDAAARSGLSRAGFAALLGRCALPDYEALEPPTLASPPHEGWLSERDDDPATLDRLDLDHAATQALTDWLVRRAPVADWCSALVLAGALRDATAGGALLAETAREWKLEPAFTRLVADLAHVAAAALAALSAETSSPATAPSARGPRSSPQPALTRPVPERIPALAPESEEEALVRMAASTPEDDDLRLVYADWLEEHGREEQAGFVRAQCELSRLEEAGVPLHSHRAEALLHRCEALEPRREGAWRALESVQTAVRRGLPAVVRCGAREFAECGQEWMAALPTLHALHLVELGGSIRDARALGAAEHLALITRLRVEGRAREAAVAELLASPRLANLTELALMQLRLRAQGVLALANAHDLSRLTRLELRASTVGDAGLAQLLGSPVVDRLSYLGLAGTRLHDPGARALAASSRLGRLTALDLQANQIHPEGALALAASPRLAQLRHLNLWGNRLEAEGLRALASSPHLAALEWLNVGGNRAGDVGAEALAGSAHFSALTSLTIDQNGLSDRGVVALASSLRLAGLRWLSVSDTSITDAGWRALAESRALVNLRELSVEGVNSEAAARALAGSRRLAGLDLLRLNAYGDAALLVAAVADRDGPPLDLYLVHESLTAEAAALAAGPGLSRVKVLRLLSVELGDRGVQALAGSPYLDNLTELALANNGIGPAGAAALAACPRLAGLTRLDLANNGLGDEGAKCLAASPHLARLAVLVLYNGVGSAGAEALASSPHLGNLRRLDLSASPVGAAGALALIRSPHLGRLSRLKLPQVVTDEAPEIRREAARRGIVV